MRQHDMPELRGTRFLEARRGEMLLVADDELMFAGWLCERVPGGPWRAVRPATLWDRAIIGEFVVMPASAMNVTVHLAW